MLGLIWIRGALGRRKARVAAEVFGIAVAIALMVAIGTFLGAAKRTMTQRSVARVAVDWQVGVQPGADPSLVRLSVGTQPGVQVTDPVGFASTSSMTATTDGTTQTTGPGVAVGLPADYEQNFPAVMRHLTGIGDGALLTQQAAANLHAAPGTVVLIGRPGLPATPVTVAGVVELPEADSFFQVPGGAAAAQATAPPDNVILLPADQWHILFDGEASARPESVHQQIHARLDRQLPPDPAAAFERVTSSARNLEARTVGAAVVGNNIGAALDAARSDALYAQVLFLFLGLPGALLAVAIAATIAASGSERRRADAALLRTRGATASTIVRLAATEGACIGSVAAAVGLLGGLGVAQIVADSAGAPSPWWVMVAFAFGVAIAVVTFAAPLWHATRRESAIEGRRPRRPARMLWQPLTAGAVLLGASAIVFNRTSGNGYNLILAPEGVPAISVSYWAFLGPTLLWIGAGCLIWALAIMVVSGGSKPLSFALRPLAGQLAPTAAASMRRQHRLIARGVVLVALTMAFAASTAAFNATYRRQSQVDALLTNGADVTISAASHTGLAAHVVGDLASLPGVRHVEPLGHRLAYVGTDLQDLYGIDPHSIISATKLQNAYFSGGSARELMSRLADTPDGVLVSAETVRDFQLQLGDRMVLRLESRTGGPPLPVAFHYIGVANEFPTAPRDSFLVANAGYVAQSSGGAGDDTLLVDTGGHDRTAVAAQARTIVGTAGTVTDLTTTRQLVGSSLTGVDLSGLTRIELGFSLVLILVTTGLVLGLGVHERRRTFAITSALGARARHIAGLVWSESSFIVILGFLVGGVLAWALTEMLVAVLSSVFDPPPESVTLPWAYLATLVVAALASVVAVSALAIRSARRTPISVLRSTA